MFFNGFPLVLICFCHYTLHNVKICRNFLGVTGCSATIKHRCVTHLCGRNAMEQVMSCEFE